MIYYKSKTPLFQAGAKIPLDIDLFLRQKRSKELKLQKEDRDNQFVAGYEPKSDAVKASNLARIQRTPDIKQDINTASDRNAFENRYKQAEWDKNKWGYAEDAATTLEVGNFIPHPITQAVGKVGAIASAALAARKAKLAYDKGDYTNTALNLGSMALSAKLGSTVSGSSNILKSNTGDRFERLFSRKGMTPPNIRNGVDLGSRPTRVISPYVNIYQQKFGQTAGQLAQNRALLGLSASDYATDFSTKNK